MISPSPCSVFFSYACTRGYEVCTVVYGLPPWAEPNWFLSADFATVKSLCVARNFPALHANTSLSYSSKKKTHNSILLIMLNPTNTIVIMLLSRQPEEANVSCSMILRRFIQCRDVPEYDFESFFFRVSTSLTIKPKSAKVFLPLIFLSTSSRFASTKTSRTGHLLLI
jgi:hypothetical protein